MSALLAYEGIQYQYMAPEVFEDAALAYLEERLRILPGFYGVLRSMDAALPYCLEMQAKAAVTEHKNLYAFWGDKLHRAVRDENGAIINLASKEYSKAIEAYLQPEDRLIICVFGGLIGGKALQKGIYAKMACGETVHYLAEIGAERPEELKRLSRSGYTYREELSTEISYVFARESGTYEEDRFGVAYARLWKRLRRASGNIDSGKSVSQEKGQGIGGEWYALGHRTECISALDSGAELYRFFTLQSG